jgi:type II secretory pathway pseudopilin PulG
MGNQKMLLVLMAVMIVGMAMLMGFTMFQENSLDANQEEVRQALLTVAARAQGWYRRPAMLGGGSRSFSRISWTKIRFDSSTHSGTFTMTNKQQASFRVTGVSKEDPSWSLSLLVFADSVAAAP